MTRNYRQRLHRLHERLDATPFAKSIANLAPASILKGCSLSTLATTAQLVRQPVSEWLRLWQREMKERQFVQNTYCPGETSRKFFARVATKCSNTIVSLGGRAFHRPTCSQELAEEMKDGWEPIMARHFKCSESTAVFLGQSSPPVGINGSKFTAVISPGDVCAAMTRIKCGKVAGPDEINNTFYREIADEIRFLPAPLYTRWFECSVLSNSF